ncbi:MAG: drug/metabolite transporter (DMT)-like permease [Gammaproteobacteria bacterium]
MQSLFSSGVIFALLSLLFAGLLDVMYKRYSRIARSRGMFLMGMGITFCTLQLFSTWVFDETLSVSDATLTYGLAAGALVTVSNILLIESFTHLDVSLGSTIYRLNTIGVVALSWLFLAESLAVLKLMGIAFGVLAALLLYQHHKQQTTHRDLALFFWLAVLASVFRAGFGVLSKAGISADGNASSMMVIAATCWIVGGFTYALVRETDRQINLTIIGYSVVSGSLVFMVVNTLYAALARGDASVVIPIANLSFVVALLISVLLKMEQLTMRKVSALAFAIVAIGLLSQQVA